MIGSEIKDFAESILDENLDETLFLTLLNVAKDNIEDDGTEWEFLKSIDSTKQALASDTYTSMKNLPTGFRRPLKEIFVGSLRYYPIRFEQREANKNGTRKFYIDYKNQQFAIIGAPSTTQTIVFPFLSTSDELTLVNEWAFPERFHKKLGFDIAGYYQMGVDADDIYARMSPENKMAAKIIANNMRRWNTSLALHAIGNSAEEESTDDSFDLGSL